MSEANAMYNDENGHRDIVTSIHTFFKRCHFLTTVHSAGETTAQGFRQGCLNFAFIDEDSHEGKK